MQVVGLDHPFAQAMMVQNGIKPPDLRAPVRLAHNVLTMAANLQAAAFSVLTHVTLPNDGWNGSHDELLRELAKAHAACFKTREAFLEWESSLERVVGGLKARAEEQLKAAMAAQAEQAREAGEGNN